MAIDLEDFKAHIGLTSSDQNDAAQGILDAANAAIANRVGPLSPEAATYTLLARSSATRTASPPSPTIFAWLSWRWADTCTPTASAGRSVSRRGPPLLAMRSRPLLLN